MLKKEIAILLAEPRNRQFDIPFLRMLGDRADVWRSRLIRNTLNKNPLERKFFKQTLIVPLTPDVTWECGPTFSCLKGISDPIPQLVRANNIMFDFIGSQDGTQQFVAAEPGAQCYLEQSSMLSKFISYEVIDNRIVVNNPSVRLMRIDGVFDQPDEVHKFNCQALGIRGECDPLEKDYPASGDIIQLIIQSINEIDLRQSLPEPPINEEVKVK